MTAYAKRFHEDEDELLLLLLDDEEEERFRFLEATGATTGADLGVTGNSTTAESIILRAAASVESSEELLSLSMSLLLLADLRFARFVE